MKSKTMEFHLGDVLTIITDRCLSPSGYEGTNGILDFMVNGNTMRLRGRPSEAAIQKCKSSLIDQFPQLAIGDMDSAIAELDKAMSGKTNYEERKKITLDWLAQQVAKYGERFTVKRIRPTHK